MRDTSGKSRTYYQQGLILELNICDGMSNDLLKIYLILESVHIYWWIADVGGQQNMTKLIVFQGESGTETDN